MLADKKYEEHGIKVKPSKVSLGAAAVDHLGHLLSLSREKIQGVHNFVRPQNSKSLERFLGLLNWFSNHVRHKAILVRPLYALLKEFKKAKAIVWNEKAIEAFEEIKKGFNLG
jgi:hypothetical protein